MNMTDPIFTQRCIRRDELRKLVPLADSTIYELEKAGNFPKRFYLTARCVAWNLAEVKAWIEERRTAIMQRTAHPDVRHRKNRPVRKSGRRSKTRAMSDSRP